MDPKENTTPLIPVGRSLGTEPTEERNTSLLNRCLVTDPKELTPKETPPLPSNSPPSSRNIHTYMNGRYFRFYILREECRYSYFRFYIHRFSVSHVRGYNLNIRQMFLNPFSHEMKRWNGGVSFSSHSVCVTSLNDSVLSSLAAVLLPGCALSCVISVLLGFVVQSEYDCTHLHKSWSLCWIWRMVLLKTKYKTLVES
jgi:hypothetical protein